MATVQSRSLNDNIFRWSLCTLDQNESKLYDRNDGSNSSEIRCTRRHRDKPKSILYRRTLAKQHFVENEIVPYDNTDWSYYSYSLNTREL